MVKKAATNHWGCTSSPEDSRVCQSIPLLAFHSKAIDSKIRILGQLRFRADFHRDGLSWVVCRGDEVIGIRIMPEVKYAFGLLILAEVDPIFAYAKAKSG